jgi:hypothetical protein
VRNHGSTVLGTQAYSHSLSLLSTAILAHYIPISSAFDRPVHLLVFGLTACSFALPGVLRAVPQFLQPPRDIKGKGDYVPLPLEDYGHANGSARDSTSAQEDLVQAEGKVRISVLLLAVTALSVRIELYRRIDASPECGISNVEVFLPLLLAVYDALRSQSHIDVQWDERPDSSVYEYIRMAISTYIVRPRYRYLLPVAALTYGLYLTLGLWASSTSTYICAAARGESTLIPLLQIGCLLLDFQLALVAYETSPRSNRGGLSGRRCVVLWSSTMIAASVIWYIAALLLYILRPELRFWLFLLSPSLELGTIVAMIAFVFLFCVWCISTLHCVSDYLWHCESTLTCPVCNPWCFGHVYIPCDRGDDCFCD